MEMTYGGAMVLPRNYVVMDEEEMTYLEGGARFGRNAYGKYIEFSNEERSALVKVLSGGAAIIGAFSAACLAASVGLIPVTFGLSLPTLAAIGGVSGLVAAVCGVGAWYFCYYSKIYY